jgi:hypothetical protein
VPIPDDVQQTAAIMEMQARRAAGLIATPADTEQWHAAQQWLEEHGCRKVLIPWAPHLRRLLPPGEIRWRRDFQQLLAAIEAVALLHQCQREKRDGAIIATEDDYAHARTLLGPIFAAASEDGLTPAVRETIERIVPGEMISLGALARRLGVAKGTASWRVKRAKDAGFIRDLEPRGGGHAGQLERTAEPLPDPNAETGLPSVDRLREARNRSNG